MRFNAIVHAPTLRGGARLNIAEADQTDVEAPHPLGPGDEVAIRFGVCCPDLSQGRIIACEPRRERAVLAIGDQSWTLLRGKVGIAIPGLVSESWFVAGADSDHAA